jgi:hypothetical protein
VNKDLLYHVGAFSGKMKNWAGFARVMMRSNFSWKRSGAAEYRLRLPTTMNRL